MKTIIAILASSAAAGLLMGACQPKAEVSQTPQPKPRTIVTCDPELDDNNSMVRFILHSTDFDIEGLVETSTTVRASIMALWSLTVGKPTP